jgi:hypothetical protein
MSSKEAVKRGIRKVIGEDVDFDDEPVDDDWDQADNFNQDHEEPEEE